MEQQTLNIDPIRRIFEQQAAMRSQSQPRIIEAEATASEPRKAASKTELALMLFLLSGSCGAVLGLILYILHHI